MWGQRFQGFISGNCLEPFGYRGRDIGAFRINDQLSFCGANQNIHIFHWHSSEEDFISEDNRPCITASIFKLYFNRAYIGANMIISICCGNIPFI